MKLVLEAHDEALRNGKEPVLDLDFITQHTHSFEAFADDLRQTNWEDILRDAGFRATSWSVWRPSTCEHAPLSSSTAWGSPNTGSALQTCSRR